MAEINFNNLYNKLSPMDKRFYDQQFQKSYDPKKENLRLSGQENYDQMKAVYDAQQKIPKSGFFDSIFGSASAAEKPTVPNLSLGYNMPTFDLGTGITNTSAATNMYTPFTTNQEMVNKDLVEQIIAENQRKANLFNPTNFQSIFPTNVQTGGITDIDLMEENQLPYSGVGDMRYSTPRTIADQNRILGQTFTKPKENFLRRMLSGASNMYGSGRDLIGTGISSLVGLASGIPGIGLLTSLINPNPQSAIDTRRLQQAGYGTQLQDIYGPGGIMQNYNMISGFGTGPLESIINRRNKILARKEAGKAYGASNLTKLNEAITSLGGSTDSNLSSYRASRPESERRSTGFGKSGMGRDPDRFA